MAGFRKNVMYNWIIENDKGIVCKRMRYTPVKAYQIFNEMKKNESGLKLYCNGELVGKR